jgi:hypothetical protein
MKWFKHYSDASDDEFIAKLESQFGLEGYARWWKILEIISKQMDETNRCHAEYPVDKWKRLLSIKQEKFLKLFLNFCQTSSKLSVNFSETFIKVECAKLLELRDEHTRKLRSKSGVTPDKVAQDLRIKNKDIEYNKTTTTISRSFSKECYEYIVGIFPNLMAKNQSPIMQWEAMGFEVAKVKDAIDQIKAQGATPDSFGYFTPVISKPPPVKKEEVKKESDIPKSLDVDAIKRRNELLMKFQSGGKT